MNQSCARSVNDLRFIGIFASVDAEVALSKVCNTHRLQFGFVIVVHDLSLPDYLYPVHVHVHV